MSPQQKVIKVLRGKIPYLKENYGVKKIALFGSFAKGSHTGASDIDMVVEFKEPDFDKFMGLSFYLENLFHRKVDILTPEGIRGIRVKKVAEDIKRSLVYV